MKKNKIITIVLVWLAAINLSAQQVEVPFTNEFWDFSNAQYDLQDYEGKPSLLLQSGFVFIKDLALLNGTIEVDINFSGLRNFPGLGFRMVDPNNFENFYVRPHQSGNSDANQYTPVFNGLSGWQLYHGSKYATAINYEFNQWHHLKIEVAGTEAKIYFDDMDKPLLVIDELLRTPEAGSVILSTRTNVHFANLKYQKSSNTTSGKSYQVADIKGLIKSWELAEIQPKEYLHEVDQLTSSHLKGLTWSEQQVESSGVLNISRYLKINQDQNTAIVRLKVKSDRRQIKQLKLGYSDFVKVFVNGQATYAGTTQFRTRDYRYLGTIGFFDAVYLPLKKGQNEIILVVSENFGGWGLQAAMEDQTGVIFN